MLNRRGHSLLEMLVVLAVFSVIAVAGSMLFVSGSTLWSFTDTHVRLQEDLRQTLQRIGKEVQESGRDNLGALQAAVVDNGGTNGTDILQFAVPICLCGERVMDENGDVRSWGAPLTWGQSGCGGPIPVGNNGKVTICHVPPGNPANENTLDVSVNAVQAHLAHGDRLGDCAACSMTGYANRLIEYRIDAAGRLLRRALDVGGNILSEAVMAEDISSFQAVIDGVNNRVTLTVTAAGQTAHGRQIDLTSEITVPLRNRG